VLVEVMQRNVSPIDNHITFAGAGEGQWRITSIASVVGETIPSSTHLRVGLRNVSESIHGAAFVLNGRTSNIRYTTRAELGDLQQKQSPLGRTGARSAALIPIKKSSQWWAMAQDERRAIFEEQSRHTSMGMEYLPQIARKLLHCRDLDEPFDFLTWFEFDPQHSHDFDRLLDRLRKTEEWKYVEREVDLRLTIA
jgi:hypothetical protein